MAFDYLPRNLHKGLNGSDVLALSRAMRATHIRKRRPTRHFGIWLQRNVKKFQKNHGLHADGVVGPLTSAKLQKYYDAYGRILIRNWAKAHPSNPTLTPRQRVIRAAYYSLQNKHYIHYRQYRPMQDMGAPPNVPNYMDCSQHFTWCYKSAKLPDPNGAGYDGYGWTGSLQVRGHLRLGPSMPGDAILSFWPISHVSVSVGRGMVISHGREGCPCLEPEFSVNTRRYYIA